MRKDLNLDQDRELRKEVNGRIQKLHSQRYARRDLSHLNENPNCEVRRSHAEKAIAKFHATGDSGRTIQKRLKPAEDDAANAIAELHCHPATYSKRRVTGNSTLVTKLAGAIAQAVRRDYSSGAEARATIKKLLE
jgi:hypothetical protein